MGLSSKMLKFVNGFVFQLDALSICTSRRSAFRSASWSHAHRRSLILGNPRHIASARRSPSPSHVGCTLSIFPITFKRAYACEDNGVARTVFPQYSLSSSSSLSPRVCLESCKFHRVRVTSDSRRSTSPFSRSSSNRSELVVVILQWLNRS